jgi:transcription elongation GreA/GreB family factor
VSKAFTKENDDLPESPMRRRGIPVPELNLVTPAGLVAARAELEHLTRAGEDADRVRELAEHLSTAQAADPPADRGEVGLGARVTVEDEEGARHVYEVVGAIESDPKRGKLSWQSPLAQALWGMRVGDGVTLPRGDGEIVAIEYP